MTDGCLRWVDASWVGAPGLQETTPAVPWFSGTQYCQLPLAGCLGGSQQARVVLLCLLNACCWLGVRCRLH